MSEVCRNWSHLIACHVILLALWMLRASILPGYVIPFRVTGVLNRPAF
jgi:hypothetical protein